MNKKFPETDAERAGLVTASMVFVVLILLIQKIKLLSSYSFIGGSLGGWQIRFGYTGLQGYLIDPCVLAAAGLLVVFGTSAARQARVLRLATFVMALVLLVLNLYTFVWVFFQYSSAFTHDFQGAFSFLQGPSMGILCTGGAALLLRARSRNVEAIDE